MLVEGLREKGSEAGEFHGLQVVDFGRQMFFLYHFKQILLEINYNLYILNWK